MILRSTTAAEENKENDPPVPSSTPPPTVDAPSPPADAPPVDVAPSPPAEAPSIEIPPAETPLPENPPVTLDGMVADLRECRDTDAISYAKSTTNNSPSYTEKRKKIIDQFIVGLAKQAPKYDKYLKKTRNDVPSFFPAEEVETLFILLRGPEDKRKKVMLLNEMLIDWVATARKKTTSHTGSIYHSPSTLNFMIRSFFASTKDYYNWNENRSN